ncbi:MAG: 2-C-methyl-D-erythritol 4-phosphate cytidylyltransferase [Luteolibacter sp.]|jgi:2-C-methyl-D-erythritol 4-phosphate cytidylyltransferase
MDAVAPAPICSAVIVASGGSRRMGFDKLSARLGDRSVLARSIDALAASPWIGEIVLVCPAGRWEEIGSPPPAGVTFLRVDGGAERQDSVAAGLAAATLGIACVHDGARPLVATSDIDRCIVAAVADGAAALAHRVADTMRRGDADGFAAEGVDRENLWAVETPQCARIDLMRDALGHVRANGKIVTDETTALAMAGVRVRLIESCFPNPKITTPADLALAHALIS